MNMRRRNLILKDDHDNDYDDIIDQRNEENERIENNRDEREENLLELLKRVLNKKFWLRTTFAVTIWTLVLLYIKIYNGSTSYLDTDGQESGSSLHESYNTHENEAQIIDRVYEKFAVSADNAYCSTLGKDIIKRGATAIEAAIATGLCDGVQNAQSMGIGGGHFMLIYIKSKNKVYSINARERAPQNAFKTMFLRKSPTVGGLATGVPGEIKGYWDAYNLQDQPQLQWKDLVQPTIDMCKHGFKISSVLSSAVKSKLKYVLKDKGLRQLFIDPSTNLTYPANHTITMPHLARTLEIIRDQPMSFYTGELAQQIVNEINENGGNMTLDDLRNYTTVITEMSGVSLKNGLTIYTSPPPSSGLMVSFILNVMKEFDYSRTTESNETLSLFYHRLIETFKHAYAKRANLGDAEFVNVSQIVSQLTSESHARYIRSKIDDSKTFPQEYYGSDSFKEDHGTAHISILHPNGDAVAFTSSINLFLGAEYAGLKTGIIYNNQMDDFSTPGESNTFGFPSSESNFIEPFKFPASSMSPIIVVDSNNQVQLVLGASGGSKIITSVAQVAIKTLWMNMTLSDAIRDRRVHHQLFPFRLEIEKDFSPSVQTRLYQLGNELKHFEYGGSSVQGIRIQSDGIHAFSDPRKCGLADGE